MKSLKGQSYSQPTIIKYRNTQLRVSQFVKKKYKRNYIFLYELDFDFIDGFETFLKTEFNNSNTTCKKHYDRVSKIVRIALNKGYINRFPFSGYKIKLDKTPLVYLTYEEVQKIEAKFFEIDRLEHCRLLALLGCYSIPWRQPRGCGADADFCAARIRLGGHFPSPWAALCRHSTRQYPGAGHPDR